MAGWSKLLDEVPRGNSKAVVAVATLSAGVMFYINRRATDARLVLYLSVLLFLYPLAFLSVQENKRDC